MHHLQKPHAVLFLLLALWGAPVLAATYTVANTSDSGAGSLRQAMLNALATAADDEIVFDSATNGTPIVLLSSLPNLAASGGGLTVTGNGVAETVISGDAQYRILNTEAADPIRLTLQKLTLHSGHVADNDEGGAVRFVGTGASSLTIDSVEFTDNYAGYGGAIVSRAPMVIRNSTFQGNYARVLATAMLIDNTSVQAENVTVSGNDSWGAQIHVGGGAAGSGRFLHLSMVNNAGPVGLGAYYGGRVTLINSIVTKNTSGGFDLEVRDGGTADTVGSVHNVIGRMSAGAGLADGVNGNQIGVASPLVGPLGNYGGPTRTLPLLPGSAARDAGTTGGDLPATDQRGMARVGAPDVGAFESRGFVLSAIGGGGQTAHVSTAFADPLVVQVTANVPVEPVEGGQVVFRTPSSGASATLDMATAAVGSDGRAQTSATANATVGGPYNVTATDAPVGGQSQTFALTNTAAPVYYTIGGNVTGLIGAGLVLQNNGGDDLARGGSGPFSFIGSVVLGGGYAVTVKTQPVGQICTVAGGSGVVNADVVDVQIDCRFAASGGVQPVPTLGSGALALLGTLLGLLALRRRM